MSLLFLCCCLAAHAAALRLPISRRSDALSLSNFADLSYHADLSLGGQHFTVLIDTGSSDLWVAGNVVQSTDTGMRGQVSYAQDGVQGPIKVASLRFGDHRVADQAFLEITPDDQHPEGHGLLGLGPSTGSFIAPLLPSTEGDPMLYRVFRQNSSVPNYFTILLGREKDHFSGSITIGEVIPEYSTILNETRLAISTTAPPADAEDGDSPSASRDQQHLQVFLDPDGIIGPDGEAIPFTSSVYQTTSPQQATVVLDSGFSLPQVPKSVSNAIYARYIGAEYVIVQGIGEAWILPCDIEVNVTFKFAGKEYPIHPLDMSMDPEPLGLGNITNSRGDRACIGTFQPFTFERGDFPSYDMVLGMAFMRNVYTLFDYGDFISGSNSSTAAPYIQLLSLTDRAEAHTDFVAVRKGGVDTPSKGTTRGEDTKDPKGAGSDDHGRRVHSAIVAAIAVAGVLALVAAFFLWRARKRTRRR